MKATETILSGCFILEPEVFTDERGYFLESYNEKKLHQILGYSPHFVQDNQSQSVYGVVRGLHMQSGKFSQAKLVRVLEGTVIDVAVDVRLGSPTFGKWVCVELSAENQKQFFIPRGFLHGFSVISDKATFFYKCDNVYNKSSENGVDPQDISLNIDWKVTSEHVMISEKDRQAQSFIEFKSKIER